MSQQTSPAQSQAWLVRLEVVAPALDTPTTDEIRSVEIAISSRTPAAAGAKAVALAKGYGWKVRAIEDVRLDSSETRDPCSPAELLEHSPSKHNLLHFPTPTGKPN